MTTDERLQRLEKEVARTRRGFLFLVLALAVCALVWTVGLDKPAGAAGPVGPNIVSANQFDLVDPNGKVRMSLEMASMGPALSVFSRSGQRQAVLLAHECGFRITGRDVIKRGSKQAILDFLYASPAVVMTGGTRKVATIGVPPGSRDGTPAAVELCDGNGKPCWRAP